MCVTQVIQNITVIFLLYFAAFSLFAAQDFIKECNISKAFDHPNVLSLIGVSIIPEEAMPLMVMPYMHHGDLKSFMKLKRGNNIRVTEFPPVKLTKYSCRLLLHLVIVANYIATYSELIF